MHQVWFLLFERFQLLDVCGPLQVFATANDELQSMGRAPMYASKVCALAAGAPVSSSGVALQASSLPRNLKRNVNTVIVPGGPGAWNPTQPQSTSGIEPLASWIRRAAPRIDRLASVCTGAFVLARTGLLDGRSAVTHWAACDPLRAAFPAIDVQHDAIYYRDDPYWTSAGVTAGIDMALGMVETDAGRDVAMNVAKKLVVFYKRPGGQSQFSSALLEQSAGDARIGELHRWIAGHLRNGLDVPTLAERLAMTPRTFARFYVRATGITPARAVEQIRLERACRLIEAHKQSIKSISLQCGFSSEEIMRRTFVRHLRVSPAEYRQRFSGE
ncbi:MAG TPA: helix-turn-helix domain-containing protein [Burkholderiaceae bacterium]|nr:helix-turn-helix domain-containing protein [Burkholderiaceae bacterium]